MMGRVGRKKVVWMRSIEQKLDPASDETGLVEQVEVGEALNTDILLAR